jgi:signal transduction histidine kinase
MAATAVPAPPRPAVPPQSAPGPPRPVASALPATPQESAAPRSAPPSAPGDHGRALPSAADSERRRLARELHDSIIQQVLAAGLAIDWCMGEVPAASPVYEQLALAKRLAGNAARELRSSLQELTQRTDGDDEDLPDLLRRLLDSRATPQLRLDLQVCGTPEPLPPATRRWLYQFAGECLFNCAVHAHARHAAIRLRYADGAVALSVADDGHGRPETLRKILAGEVPGTGGAYHYGLTDIAARAREMGWTLRVSRADLGGIAMEAQLPTGQVPDITGDGGE